MDTSRQTPLLAGLVAFLFFAAPADARPPIRSSFFTLYPGAVDTPLDELPSNANHCGVCHFDFDGGGPRNPYGLAIEVGLGNDLTKEQAILAIQGSDTDGDGFPNFTEITDVANFTNTPTFPGLTAGNAGGALHVTMSDITPYLTPSGSADTTPPSVHVLWPAGGESIPAGGFRSVMYTATDASGVAHVNVWLSDNGGATYSPVGRLESPSGSFQWFVPNLPGIANRIRVEAIDSVGNPGYDDSDVDFTITGVTGGLVPTSIRDMKLPGTQPLEGAVLDSPADCATCHGGYNAAVEPTFNWRGSPMGQAMRDPLFLACVTVAEQDAPSVGDLCLRCHSPGGWQEGRSVDTSGSLINAKDRESIQCDFCHRAVDHDYVPGISPAEDVPVLADISPLPLQFGNGQFVTDPAPLRRGPFADAQASHAFLYSPLHGSADLCGTCHDVSNPVFVRVGGEDYAPDAFDEEHPDFDVRDMFPIERTFSEWSRSAYATGGVYAPQFAGNKPGGMVSTCQDCHMRDVTGKGCSEGGVQSRSDLPLHDLTGGNTFLADILPLFYPGEVDAAQLGAAKARAISMLQLAATVSATPETFGLTVRVTNETAHRLPSGYPEGRRVWLHVRAVDAAGATVFESGLWNPASGELPHDPQLRVYETHPGLSPGLAGALGLPAGPSFHFVLNDTVWFDNRIPPRGFTNAAFQEIQSPPVGSTYADGQYWDDAPYHLPASAETAHVALYYQTTTKEYVEFLRDANTTNAAGQDLYDAWVATGKSAPILMSSLVVPLGEIVTDSPTEPATERLVLTVGMPWPNPFRASTAIELALPNRGHVSVRVFDTSGRLVRTVVDGTLEAREHELAWDGRDDAGRRATAGIYFVEVRAESRTFHRKVVLLR